MMSKVITGNPGVGKHTVAKKLAKRLDLDLIDINKIVVNSGIFEKKDETVDVDIKMLKKTLTKEITDNSLVVGHLAPYVVPRKNVDVAVVLRKSPYKLISIYRKRNYSQQKSIENLGSEILGVIYYDASHKFGHDKTFQIDATAKAISSIVNKIAGLFQSDNLQEDKVDWLGMIADKNDLKRFFPY